MTNSRLYRLYSSWLPTFFAPCGNHRLISWLFLKGLGLIYIVAFLSLFVQVTGLFGEVGITPLQSLLDANRTQISFFRLPTLFWFSATDTVLKGACLLGALAALVHLFGWCSRLCLGLCFYLYLSFVLIGQPFLSFQWDVLLIETGFLALFFIPFRWRLTRQSWPAPPLFMVWLGRWLVFRLLITSGLVKLASQDPGWKQLYALSYHYETQPLPHIGSWIAHQLPYVFQSISTYLTLFIETCLPLFIFSTRRFRHYTAHILIGLMVLIFCTGNYGFFNLLSIVLLVLLYDDQVFRQPYKHIKTPSVSRLSIGTRLTVLIALCLFIFSFHVESQRFLRQPLLPSFIAKVMQPLRQFSLINTYGLFAVMTTNRIEVELQGSMDGRSWSSYQFRYKPLSLTTAPRWAQPHMPRLDWQLWFAALSSFDRQPWLGSLMTRLLKGQPEVLKLLSPDSPFQDTPPTYIRAMRYDYKFSNPSHLSKEGLWWKRSLVGPYSTVYNL